MPSTGSINWRESDAEKLTQAVRKFNAKRTRAIKRSPETVDLQPDKASAKALRELIHSRQDFNTIIKRLERYSSKGAEELTFVPGTKILTTRYQLKEVQLALKAQNIKRAARKKKIDPTPAKGTMGLIKELDLAPKKVNLKNIPPSKWREFAERAERRALSGYDMERMQLYKENYIKALYTVFGSRADDVVSRVEKISPEKLVDFMEDTVLNISFAYGQEEADFKLELLEERLDELEAESEDEEPE